MPVQTLDCTQLRCPIPIVRISQVVKEMSVGDRLHIHASDPAFRADLEAWLRRLGHLLVEFQDGPVQRAVIEKRGSKSMPENETMDRIHPVSVAAAATPSQMAPQTRSGLTILAFSGDLDKLLAVFTLATSAAAMGMPVTVFFAFWGLLGLKRRARFQGKGLLGMLLTAKEPSRPEKLSLSKWNLLGLGRCLFGVAMRKSRMETLRRLIDLAREMDVRLIACHTSMSALAITQEELLEGVEIGGAATFLEAAQSSGATMFI